MISSLPHDSSRAAGSFGKNMRFMEQGVNGQFIESARFYACSANFFLSRSICFW